MVKLKIERTLLFAFIFLFSCSRNSERSSLTENDAEEIVAESLASQKKEVVCFVYHRFGDIRYPSTNISISDFSAHLQYLKDQKFTILTLSKAVDYLRDNEVDEIKKVAVITIDDGYKSFFENGLPLLEQFNYPATLFINTETVGGNTYMDWEELAKVQRTGIEIGNHTHSHAFFLDIPKEERYEKFETELAKSQKIIEENLGKKPEVFAYPYGEFDPDMKSIVEKAGFKAAAAQNSGVIYVGSDRYALPRFPMSTSYSAIEKFREKANMRALKVVSEIPGSFILPDNSKAPELQITFQKDDLQINQIQCFVQRGKCKMNVLTAENDLITIKAVAENVLKARRTLYTITIPSKSGEWHWFSHLWINPEVAGE